MSAEPQAGDPMALHANMAGCQCASCRPFPSNTPGFIDTRPPHEPAAVPRQPWQLDEPTIPSPEADGQALDSDAEALQRALIHAAHGWGHAAGKLRAQRKRHAQREAALHAKLDEAEAKAVCLEHELQRIKREVIFPRAKTMDIAERLCRLESVGRVEIVGRDLFLVRVGELDTRK